MNNEKELNLAPIIEKILKEEPGHIFYSPVIGDAKIMSIDEEEIKMKCTNHKARMWLNVYGHMREVDGECLIFPSKENRDWATIIKKEKHIFKPFERVLVRYDDDDSWRIDLFEECKSAYYICMTDVFNQCIPYEGNEHLLGTTNKQNNK